MSSNEHWHIPEQSETFERLCCFIAQEKYKDPDAQPYGNPDERHSAINIIAIDRTNAEKQTVVICCDLSVADDSATAIETKLEDKLQQAQKANRRFDRYVFATQIRRQAKNQDVAAQLSEKYNLDVVIWSADDIRLAVQKSKLLTALYCDTQSVVSTAEIAPSNSDQQESLPISLQQTSIEKILNTPPVQLQVFMGRDEELSQIHDKLNGESHRLLLVNGEGGVGKTALATVYYHQHIDQYEHLAWLCADNGIVDALLSLEGPLNIVQDETLRINERLSRIQTALANLDGPCLLVIDNANDPQDLKDNLALLDVFPNFHALITTRVLDVNYDEQYPVAQLDEDTAKALYLEHNPSHNNVEDSLLLKVFGNVGFNTLVIELLAKTLSFKNRYKTTSSLEQLLNQIDACGDTDFRQVVDQSNQSPPNSKTPEQVITAIYKMSTLSDTEQQLLTIFSLLPAEPIKLAHLDAMIIDIVELPIQLENLCIKGWIEFNEAEQTFKCSPVVQEVVKEQTKDSSGQRCDWLAFELSVLLEANHEQDELLNTSPVDAAIFARYAEHLLEVVNAPSHRMLMFFESVGLYYESIGFLEKALKFYNGKNQVAQAICQASPNDTMHNNALAVTYAKIGKIQLDMGRPEAALEHYQRYFELREQLYSENPENIDYQHGLALAYESLGFTFTEMGQLDTAMVHYQKASEQLEALHQNHPQNTTFKNSLAIAYEKLGYTHLALGKRDKALEYYSNESKLFESLLDDHPQNTAYKSGLAIAYEKLGLTHLAQGNRTEALEYYRNETQLFESLLKEQPNNVEFKSALAIAYEKSGDAHLMMGNLTKALMLFDDKLKLYQDLAKHHPQNVAYKNGMAVAYEKLGTTYNAMGEQQQAMEYYQNETKLFKALHEDDPLNIKFRNSLAIAYSKLGKAYSAQGDLDKALAYYELDTELSKNLAEEQPQNINFQNNLAVSHAKLGDFYQRQRNDRDLARPCFEQARDIWQQINQKSPGFEQYQRFLAMVNKRLADGEEPEQEQVIG